MATDSTSIVGEPSSGAAILVTPAAPTSKLLEQRFLLSALVIALAALYDFAITFFHPVLDKELITVIITALNASGLVTAINYWLGSSQSSKEANATIADLSR